MRKPRFNLIEKEYWTLEETAVYLGCALSTLKLRERHLLIPGLHQAAGQYYYNAEKVKQWIKSKHIKNIDEFLKKQNNRGKHKRDRIAK